VLRWCEKNAPATFSGVHPPASTEEIAEAERLTGVDWVPDLRALFLVANGSRRHDDAGRFLGSVLPYSDLLPLDRIQHVGRLALVVEAEIGWGDREPSHQAEAGGIAGFFSPAFVPFSALDSEYQWIVDLRAGDHRGCVGRFDIENKDTGALWSSLEHLFDETLFALHHTSPLDWRTPSVTDGALTWT
jgi:cell wall assembly regulator SMI1